MLPDSLAGGGIEGPDARIEGSSRSGREGLRGGEEHHPLLEERDVHPVERRIVCRRPPVRPALGAGEDGAAASTVVRVGARAQGARRQSPENRTAVGIQALGPVLLHERHTLDEGAGLRVEHVVKPVAIGPEDALLRACRRHWALRTVGRDQHRDLVGVPIVGVAGSKLEVPEEFPGRTLQGDDRTGIKVVARAAAGVEVRLRVADPPVDGVGLRIVGPGHPGTSPPHLPRIPFPRLMPGLSRPGNRIEPPARLARPRIVSSDESPAVARSRPDTRDDQPIQRQRRRADVGGGIVAIDDCFPRNLASRGAQRCQLRVPGSDVHLVIQQGDAAILADRPLPATYALIGMLVHPDAMAVHAIERHHTCRGNCHEQHTVAHYWGGFDLVGVAVELNDPAQSQLTDVLGVDLGQRTVAHRGIRPGKIQPVGARLGRGSELCIG